MPALSLLQLARHRPKPWGNGIKQKSAVPVLMGLSSIGRESQTHRNVQLPIVKSATRGRLGWEGV